MIFLPSASQDIYLQNPSVCWDDIIGLSTAKRLVKEAVIYPMKVRANLLTLAMGLQLSWSHFQNYRENSKAVSLHSKYVICSPHQDYL